MHFSPANPHTREKQQLIQEIQSEVKLCSRELGFEYLSEPVLEALQSVPREAFVPEEYQYAAYDNRPLPIGGGQTISQPFIVAIMTHMLDPKPTDTILEIGTGSGYQAAILASLVHHVYSIEYDPKLADRAAKTLERLGINNVTIRQGDGFDGWPEADPFDGIIVTAAAEKIAPPLLEQLRVGGRLVIPIDKQWLGQELCLYTKESKDKIHCQSTISVAFVPFRGKIRSTSGTGDNNDL
ncbi:MAG TPA: protein-L-isoaspartate O-methyltransferase [Gammaproteobacteria bacterium]|nr:protein-L-isoaspartate O-methyltransferase [Gammaproteobacteria bacterium]